MSRPASFVARRDQASGHVTVNTTTKGAIQNVTVGLAQMHAPRGARPRLDPAYL